MRISNMKVGETKFFIQAKKQHEGATFHHIMKWDIPTYAEAKEELNKIKTLEPTAYIFEGTRRQ